MGRAFVYGDNVDTDRLFPGRFMFIADAEGMRAHALEDLDPDFRAQVQPGDVVVGGRNFGCGSSREQAVACLKHTGVEAVVARSFARIYYRNAINNGLAPLICPEAAERIRTGDQVTVDLAGGRITNATRTESYQFDPMPAFLLDIVNDGGLIEHLQKRLRVDA
ncbi:MAG: 3-isopropylmalate dehydratase small subunit [Thermoplasmatota archaeon]